MFICDDDTVTYNASTGTLNVAAIGRVIDSLDAGEGYVDITCTYKYGSGEGETMTATQNLIVEVTAPDFASLKVGTQSSTHGFTQYNNATDLTSMRELTGSLTDVENGLYLRHNYTSFNTVGLNMFALRVGGVEYTSDSEGNVYRTVKDAAGATTQELIATITVGEKQTDNTYGYDYYELTVDYQLEQDATLVAKVNSATSLEVKVSGVPKEDSGSGSGGSGSGGSGSGNDSGKSTLASKEMFASKSMLISKNVYIGKRA